MIKIVEFLLQYFPTDTLVPYFTIFLFAIVTGAIVNSVWPGDKPKAIQEKKGPKIEDSVKKCKSCGQPSRDEKICPYCGAPNDNENKSMINNKK